MPVGRDPKQVDWHKLGKPVHIKKQMRFIRGFCGGTIIIGLVPLILGILAEDVLCLSTGLVLSGGALAILINWELIKRDYTKNYKKNLRQWKKTKKNNTGRN